MSETKILRFVLGDQMSRNLSSLADAVPGRDVIFLAEVMGEATSVRHHKKKIAFLFTAMRHFAEDLRADGFDVDYLALDDDGNPGTFGAALADAVRRNDAHRVVMTEPSEVRVLSDAQTWREELSVDLEIRTDTRFLASHEDFVSWAVNDKGQQPKSLRMEYFYREMRRRTGYLMVDGEPEGGQWNFDPTTATALPARGHNIPVRPRLSRDEITTNVMELVRAQRFARHCLRSPNPVLAHPSVDRGRMRLPYSWTGFIRRGSY